ncbi:hypothetical protein [Caldalkalibacillus mannanilyticus]|uniref:hypothetical protein n=1 Tax=Caldalkalibacillus mannanilyticus TaxID=1418 RepID=UPI0004687E0A|nr:hypothetical protein [Caldalkalibacillus mannanilyticus]
MPVEGTDIDYGIYDKESHSLILFEMKWFVEPVTSVEIKSKDQEISKGLHVQLPKYKEVVENNIKDFTLKAFHRELEVKKISYFVLTRVSIGSGLIEPSPFTVVNIRMFKKALFDAKGQLNVAAENLQNGSYYPKINEEFSLEKVTIMMRKVKVIVDSFKILNNSFDLSVPNDEIVHLHGIEMNPDKMPKSRARQVGKSQYELIIKSPSSVKKGRNKKKRKRRKRAKKK